MTTLSSLLQWWHGCFFFFLLSHPHRFEQNRTALWLARNIFPQWAHGLVFFSMDLAAHSFPTHFFEQSTILGLLGSNSFPHIRQVMNATRCRVDA